MSNFMLYDPEYEKKSSQLKCGGLLNRVGIVDLDTSEDEKWRHEQGWTHVLSVLDAETKHSDKRINVMDADGVDLKSHFDDAANWIHARLTENIINKVLVHCFAGISRSPSIVAAYMIKYHNYGASRALATIKAYRSIIYPNNGFRQQLEEYAEEQVQKILKPELQAKFGTSITRFFWTCVARHDPQALLRILSFL